MSARELAAEVHPSDAARRAGMCGESLSDFVCTLARDHGLVLHEAWAGDEEGVVASWLDDGQIRQVACVDQALTAGEGWSPSARKWLSRWLEW